MTELTTIDHEALRLITRFAGATDRMEDALSQADARQLLREACAYDVPGAQLSEDTRSLISQLQRSLSPTPYEGWRDQVALIAWQAEHYLTVAGVKA